MKGVQEVGGNFYGNFLSKLSFFVGLAKGRWIFI
jgi:hypothetical protein